MPGPLSTARRLVFALAVAAFTSSVGGCSGGGGAGEDGDASSDAGHNESDSGLPDAVGDGADTVPLDLGGDLAGDAGLDRGVDAEADASEADGQGDDGAADLGPGSDAELDAADAADAADASADAEDGGDGGDLADVGGGDATGDADGGGSVEVEGDLVRCLGNGWCWDLPRIGGADVNGLWGASGDQLWAVGSSGHLAYFDGGDWLAVESPVDVDLRGVHGTGPRDVWAVGAEGEIIHFDGDDWTRSSSGVDNTLYGVWAGSEDDAWAVGASGTVLRWNGSRWSIEASGVINLLRDVSGTGSDDVWIVGANRIVLHWDGEELEEVYETISGVALHGVLALPGGESWAAGTGGVVRHQFTDAGTNIDIGSEDLWAIAGLAFDDLWVVGSDGFHAHWDGLDWDGATLEGGGELRAVWTDGATLRAAGRYGTRVAYDFEAETLAFERGHLSTDAIVDFVALAGEEAWALTERALHRRDADGWSFVAELPWADPAGLWVAAPNDVWVVGASESIARWNGASWTPVVFNAPGTLDYSDIWGLDEEQVYVAAEDELYEWDGDMWLREFDVEGRVLEMFLVDEDTRYAVTGSNIYEWDPPFGWDELDGPAGGADLDTAILGADGRFYMTENPSSLGDDAVIRVFDPAGTGAAAWTEIEAPDLTVQGAWGSGPTNIWVLSSGQEFRRWNGVSWTAGIDLAAAVGLEMVAGPDALYGFSWAGHVLRYEL